MGRHGGTNRDQVVTNGKAGSRPVSRRDCPSLPGLCTLPLSVTLQGWETEKLFSCGHCAASLWQLLPCCGSILGGHKPQAPRQCLSRLNRHSTSDATPASCFPLPLSCAVFPTASSMHFSLLLNETISQSECSSTSVIYFSPARAIVCRKSPMYNPNHKDRFTQSGVGLDFTNLYSSKGSHRFGNQGSA